MTMRLTKQSLEIIVVVVLLLVIGMSATIVPFITLPKDRVFAGFHGYSSDYIQYVSYIKEGMYGRYYMDFRSFPPDQPATPIHWLYIFSGILFGPFGLSAPVIYHIVRVILGSLLIYSVYRIFLELFRAHQLALFSTMIAFVSSCVGWISQTGGIWSVRILNYFPFYISTPQRVADRPHYLLGSVLFLVVMYLVLRAKFNPYTILVLCFVSFVTVIVHTASGVVLALLSLAMIGIHLIQRKISDHKVYTAWFGFSIGFGCGLGALVTYYYVQQYSLVSNIFIDQYAYSSPRNLANLLHEAISFGPLLWIGLPGLFIGLFKSSSINIYKRAVLFAWGVIHVLLFMVLYPLFHVDQVRFVQSLYYIPLTYGTIWLLWAISKRFSRLIFYGGVALVIVVSLPTYFSHAYTDLFAMTDYRTYATFGFPTKNQFAAYQFLDRNSPKESTVLAFYEAANMLLIYSHNRVLGNDQGWSPDGGQTMKQGVANWFSGKESDSDAYNFLTINNVSYVYYGYQERWLGDITKYPFLKKVYENPEAIVYRFER